MELLKRKYEIDDECWIALTEGPELSQGQVRGRFTLPEHPADYYIVRICDPDWPILEIRDATLMSPSKHGPVGYPIIPYPAIPPKHYPGLPFPQNPEARHV